MRPQDKPFGSTIRRHTGMQGHLIMVFYIEVFLILRITRVKKYTCRRGDARLIALDAINGKPVETFGTLGNGSVNLLSDVPRLNQSTLRLDNAHNQPDVPDLAGVVSQLGHSSPGIVCDDVLILGSQVHDGEVLPPTPPGDVRGFDLNTGERLWTFHTVPREGGVWCRHLG